LNMQQLPSQTDVLVVGAGPTGLTLAAELRRRGIPALTVDRLPEGENTSRAAVIHAHTLEVLEPLGIASTLIAEGVKVPLFRIRDRDTTLLAIDFSGIPSAYAYTLMCPQNRTEAILLERLQALGGNILRPAEVTGFRLSGNEVQVAIKDVAITAEGASQTVKSQWLIGCDGMHSRVRDIAGISFAGEAYEQSFILADVHMDWPLPREEVNLFFSPDGLVVVAPLPENRFRIVATVDHAPAVIPMEAVQALLDTRGPQSSPARIRDCVWTSRFRVHHRIAASPRKGHVLLCGDAAHVHSPAGGQGMNTGIQDAMSLAEVLAAVMGGAEERRLDEWAAQRHQIAEGVVTLTDRLTRIATLRSPLSRALRNAALVFAGHVPPLTGALARNIAELDR
jgi:2-polyprenyl-6-methoxyphenol hydroxylase-like FAD-dependent oxidoreductase